MLSLMCNHCLTTYNLEPITVIRRQKRSHFSMCTDCADSWQSANDSFHLTDKNPLILKEAKA